MMVIVITDTWLTGNIFRPDNLHFQAKSFENYQLTFVYEGISVRVAIIYRLHSTKNNNLKAAEFFKEFLKFVLSLLPTVAIY